MKLEAVIFDLDGTLTVPHLDFDAIRREIGGISGPILEAMLAMSADDRRRCETILHRYELDAAENSQLNPGAHKLLERLQSENRRVGLLTRNRHDSVERICRIHGLSFDAVVTREDGPAKPDPFGVYLACETMKVDPKQACVVGDYVFDLTAGRRAGSISVLLSTNENYAEFVHEADYVIADLDEMHGVIDAIENGRPSES